MEKVRRRGARSPHIPNKLYFRIGEVSDLVGVKPYVLRYWESEFPDIRPSKSKSGQRLYKRRDVELLVRIKELLYDERFTINGARKRLKDLGRSDIKDAVSDLEGEARSPRQLEAFSEDVHEQSVRGRKDVSSKPLPRDSTKALRKIRKDLEELLTVVRA